MRLSSGNGTDDRDGQDLSMESTQSPPASTTVVDVGGCFQHAITI